MEQVAPNGEVARLPIGPYWRVIEEHSITTQDDELGLTKTAKSFGWLLIDRQGTVLAAGAPYSSGSAPEAAESFERVRKVMSYPAEAQVQRQLENQAGAITTLNAVIEDLKRDRFRKMRRLILTNRALFMACVALGALAAASIAIKHIGGIL